MFILKRSEKYTFLYIILFVLRVFFYQENIFAQKNFRKVLYMT